ncbi:hypothetical protein [Pseudomonas sp. KNUC1026]|uniref:hypothetical protein n=1 Tax=Pseudomonas sp. KNUC1026 TaxID=2893890 RepID=UPI001F321B55|nr:hypothetical protein [Pseudomonas sp. KNUC1026]UFH47982.1 hypothetical protein LN139_12075 [Pseudomonas sp. KNUC1026]
MGGGSQNFIYERLVESEDDILGIIAYSLYKRQKIEYIEAFCKRNGRPACSADLTQFHEVSNSAFQLQAYRTQADNIAQSFLTITLEGRAEQLEDHYQSKLKSEMQAYKPNYWLGVSQGVVASIIFVLLLGLLVISRMEPQPGPPSGDRADIRCDDL